MHVGLSFEILFPIFLYFLIFRFFCTILYFPSPLFSSAPFSLSFFRLSAFPSSFLSVLFCICCFPFVFSPRGYFWTILLFPSFTVFPLSLYFLLYFVFLCSHLISAVKRIVMVYTTALFFPLFAISSLFFYVASSPWSLGSRIASRCLLPNSPTVADHQRITEASPLESRGFGRTIRFKVWIFHETRRLASLW